VKASKIGEQQLQIMRGWWMRLPIKRATQLPLSKRASQW